MIKIYHHMNVACPFHTYVVHAPVICGSTTAETANKR